MTNDVVECAVRNLPGFKLCCVDSLNFLQLAPSRNMGLFCIWAQSALDALVVIYGVGGKNIPEDLMANANLTRIINSNGVQLTLNPAA